jgi:hypothetical protein
MSLLTEEQIAELVGIASNQSTSKDLYQEFCEWNERQTATQFEPDWNNTSSKIARVDLDAVWFNSEIREVERTTICSWDRPKPVITPHPHAEMIAKYAEVAARRIDPWVEFEVNLDNNWEKIMGNPAWLDYREYRYIGETK